MVSLLDQLHSRLHDLLPFHRHCGVGNAVFNALEVSLFDFSLHQSVFCCIDERGVLLQSEFEPFPDFAFEVRLAAQSESLA